MNTTSFIHTRHGRPIRPYVITLLTMLCMILTASTTPAAGLTNARAVAMAGAYTSLAKGYYSPSFNPANLGLPSYRLRGFQVIGFGVSIKNNSFSLDDYNTYTGARLNEDDKQKLLSKIPAEGLQASADGEFNLVGFAMENFAISLSAMGAAEINIGRAPVELLLQGNSFADTINLDGIYGEGYGLGAVNFSYGHLIYKSVDRQLAVGGTLRYLKGFGYEEITEANGHAVTLISGFEGVGSLVSRTASGGSGFSLDLGGTLQINKDYTVGLTFFNFLSAIRWNRDTKEHRYMFSFDTVTVADMSEDSVFTSTDTTITTGSFTSHLPSVIKVGLARTSGKLLWAFDWEQGFKKAAGSSSTPRISAGGEYRVFRFLPLRAGFGIGGKQGATYAGGFGIEYSLFHLDLGVANYNAISGPSGKGLNFAVNSGFLF